MEEIESCPVPILFGDDVDIEESVNPELEKQLDFQYWFPSVGEPKNTTSTFNSQSEFIDALLKSKEPTMIFCSNKYQPDYKLTLPSVFPLHFPFGSGGIEEFRRTKVSVEEYLKHYLKISCPQFQKADIILVIGHMFFRKKSFETSYLKCMSKSNISGLSTGERLSKISEAEILKLAHTPNFSNLDNLVPATSLLHTVSAACKNIPYTDEAASEARAKLF